MKSFTSVTRRGAILVTAALSAFALTACSAGQITQTDTQVAAVNGVDISTSVSGLALRDATVIVDEDNKASLKFTVINEDPKSTPHELASVTVNGKAVELPEDLTKTIPAGGTLVIAPKAQLDSMPKSDSKVDGYGTIELENQGFAYGSHAQLEVTFGNGATSEKAEVPVAGLHVKSGEHTFTVDGK